ncbi:MAG: hypothetical protein MZU95_08095 [Desulfomicrobium escambiense]|nr:hypothetical protein [Desulfomicrobium escambiense]
MSVLLPAPFSPTSAWTSLCSKLERHMVVRLKRAEILADVEHFDDVGHAITP